MKTIEMTLIYFIKDSKILLPLKLKKIGKNKHNGVGGNVEDHQTIEETTVRECIEEVGLKPLDFDNAGILEVETLDDNDEDICYVIYLFTCKKWEGTLMESSEMKPYWFNTDAIPYEKMMSDNKYWLPLLLDNKKINAYFKTDKNSKILNYKVNEIKTNKTKRR